MSQFLIRKRSGTTRPYFIEGPPHPGLAIGPRVSDYFRSVEQARRWAMRELGIVLTERDVRGRP